MGIWEIENLKRDLKICKDSFPNTVYDCHEVEYQIDRVLEQVIPDAIEIADWLLYEVDKNEVTNQLIKDLRRFSRDQIVFLAKFSISVMGEAPELEEWLDTVTGTVHNFYRTAVNLLHSFKHTATD